MQSSTLRQQIGYQNYFGQSELTWLASKKKTPRSTFNIVTWLNFSICRFIFLNNTLARQFSLFTDFFLFQITANGTTPFYSPLQTGYPSGQHFHPAMQGNGGHLQPQQPTMSHHSPHSPSPPNSNYHKDERSQRQHAKLVRKLDKQKSRDMSKYLYIVLQKDSAMQINYAGFV